jgi:hypothetical protein
MPAVEDTTTNRTTSARPSQPSHFVEYDRPGTRLSRALCGRLVDRHRDHTTEPTCPECRAALESLNNMSF